MVKNGFRRQAVFSMFRQMCDNGQCSIDNKNERQETLTGPGTTHDTNETIFQFLSTEEN